MPDDAKEHYFACNLLWWSLRVSFARPELLQTGDLAERIEAYNERLEELGLWLMAELVHRGRALAGDTGDAAQLNPPDIEQRLTRALKALEDLAASAAPVRESRAYCVYVAECGWVGASLRAFVELERSLSSEDASTKFRQIEAEILDVIAWIEAQRDEVTAAHLPADTLHALRDNTAPAIAATAHAWRDDVRAYSARDPR
jgi:hypothetical protein